MAQDLQARKNEIIALLSAGSTDENLYKELKEINTKDQKAKNERAGELAGLKKAISELGISITELFSLDDIKKVLPKSKTTKRISPKNTSEVLISVPSPSGKGLPAKYNKGQDLPQYVPAAFKALFEKAGNEPAFIEAIAGHSTEEGKAYFGTDEGKAELLKFVAFVKDKNLMPKKNKAAEAP